MQQAQTSTRLESGQVLLLPPALIRPNPGQPRQIFDDAALQELADSVKEHGILQPVTVRRRQGHYELVAGERRLRAAKLAGLAELPCIVMELDDADSELLALVENLQRRDLDFVEQAQGIARLIGRYGLSQEEAARRLGKSQSAVANKLRLLKLGPDLLAELRRLGLTERHGRALLQLADEQARKTALEQMAARAMSVAEAEQYVACLARPAPQRRKRTLHMRDLRLFLNAVEHHLDTLRAAGFGAESERSEDESTLTVTLRLSKKPDADRAKSQRAKPAKSQTSSCAGNKSVVK